MNNVNTLQRRNKKILDWWNHALQHLLSLTRLTIYEVHPNSEHIPSDPIRKDVFFLEASVLSCNQKGENESQTIKIGKDLKLLSTQYQLQWIEQNILANVWL